MGVEGGVKPLVAQLGGNRLGGQQVFHGAVGDETGQVA